MIRDLIVRKVYSDLSFSKILFLFCVTKLTEVHVFNIISSDLTGRVILVLPKGIEIEDLPCTLKLSFEVLLETGKQKLFWSIISYPIILQSLTNNFLIKLFLLLLFIFLINFQFQFLTFYFHRIIYYIKCLIYYLILCF